MAKILGIDLGTTNSVVAVWDDSGPRVVLTDLGARLIPSVVGFPDNGDVHVGEAARHGADRADRTIYSAKRFIGRTFDDVASEREEVPYEVVASENGRAHFLVGDEMWSPEEISAFVLRELKKAAEEFLGESISGAVITAPAHFNDSQRAATREAARLAGLDVRRILNEPTAAALAYGLDRIMDGERIVAVYDFGGGTFDVSILSMGDDILQVLATSGDPHLGGDLIDSSIAAWLLAEFARTTGIQPDEDAETLRLVREAAEELKIALSDQDAVEIDLPFPGESDGDGGQPHLRTTFTRAMFDGMIGKLVDRTLECCDRVLVDARKLPVQIDEVVLAGGSTRIPLVRQRVAEYFNKQPLCDIDPDEVVAMGAAVQAGILAGDVKGVILVDVTSLSLGIQTHDGGTAVITPRNTVIPVSATRSFTTVRDDQTLVQFDVVQGESERADRNHRLGNFRLDGLRPAKAGTSKIDVTFAIDINGMVLVTAHDHDTGREQSVTVSVAPASAGARAPTPVAAAPAPAEARPEATAAGDANLPAAALATLEDAGKLLAEAGQRMSRVDRASIMKQVAYLRSMVADDASPEEIERTRAALAKIVIRVRGARIPRGRDDVPGRGPAWEKPRVRPRP